MVKIYSKLVGRHLAGFLLIFGCSFGGFSASAQTPGLIFKQATGAGKTILDPNNDGYVSEPN